MSIAAMSYVWENSQQEGGALLVLLAIADYSNEAGDAYPAVKTLAKKSRLGERQTQYVLRKLEADGEIQIIPNRGPSGANVYRIARKRTETQGKGAETAGVQPASPRGAAHCAKGVTPTAPNPSDNRQEPSGLVLSGDVEGKKKKHKAGHVNGSHPAQATIEAFCVSLGLPKSDGELMMMKWNADGWPKNWMDKLRYWQRRHWLPSQETPRFGNGRSGRPLAPQVYHGPNGWEQWLESKPEYLAKMKGRPFNELPEFMRLECNRDLKAKS